MNMAKETPELGCNRGGKNAFGKQPQYCTLQDAIAAAGLGAPDIIHDGVIHRFTSPDDKPGSNNCWYVSHGSAGAYGSWKLGFTQTWSDGKAENNAELLEEIREYQRDREADLEIIRNDVAAEAQKLWLSASTEIVHQYPTRQQITPYGARQSGNTLLVPMYFKGKLSNLQRVYPDGAKRFLKGGRVTGCYMPMGDLSDHLHICEGYATGTNPGLEKGRAAAAAVGGDYIWPVFDHVEDATGISDFNDYLNTEGEL